MCKNEIAYSPISQSGYISAWVMAETAKDRQTLKSKTNCEEAEKNNKSIKKNRPAQKASRQCSKFESSYLGGCCAGRLVS
jgi:hypothetical protein